MLTTLKEHPDAWTRVDTILEFSNNQQTKYYALQILEQVIKTRWKVLPRNQCEGKECSLRCDGWLSVPYSKNLHSLKWLCGHFISWGSGNIFTDNRTCITHITLNSLHLNCKRHSDEEGSGKTFDPSCISLSISKLPPYFFVGCALFSWCQEVEPRALLNILT